MGRGGGRPSPRSSPHSCVVGRGRRKARDKNRRSLRRFRPIPTEYNSALRRGAKGSLSVVALLSVLILPAWLLAQDEFDINRSGGAKRIPISLDGYSGEVL